MSSPATVPCWRTPRGFRCTERLDFGSSSPLCRVRHCRQPPEFFLVVHHNGFIGPGVNLFPWTHTGAVVPFQLESDLLEPVTTWLHAAGFDVFDEVPILRHRADVVGLRGDGVTAIEMKLSKWDQALRQAIAYQLAADWAWVAMPLSTASRAYHQRWRFEAERVGLLAIDERGGVRAPILARPSPRLLPFVQERILEWWRDSDKKLRNTPLGSTRVQTRKNGSIPR